MKKRKIKMKTKKNRKIELLSSIAYIVGTTAVKVFK